MANPLFQQGSFPKRGCPQLRSDTSANGAGTHARSNRNQRVARAFQRETVQSSAKHWLRRVTDPRERLSRKESHMPAKSGAQQKAAGAALAAKRGERKASSLKGASRSMYESMSERELDELASTRRKGKPEHVSSATEKE
jgi:hypothetical protein